MNRFAAPQSAIGSLRSFIVSVFLWTLRWSAAAAGVLCLAACGGPGVDALDSVPRVKAGVLDLRSQEAALASDAASISLAGPWQFRWREFVEPGAGEAAWQDAPFFSVPGFWNDRSAGNQELSPQGYATYRLMILRDAEAAPELLAVRMIDLESAYELYANGRLIGRNGDPAISQAQEQPEWRPAVHAFAAAGDVELILHVSNFYHRLGGVWEDPQFGTAEQMHAVRNHRIALELALAAAIFSIGLYHALIFVLRRAELPYLALGLFCAVMALRTLITGERFLQELLPLSWNWVVRLDYLSVYIGTPLCHWYLQRIYRRDYWPGAFYILLAFSALCSLIVVFFEPLVFTHLAGIYHLALLAVSLYFNVVSFLAVWRRRPDAWLLALSWLVFTLSNFHDILYVQSLIASRYMFAVGLMAFLAPQSYILAKRYAGAFEAQQILGRRVERLLDKTRALNRSRDAGGAVRTALHGVAEALGRIDGMRAFVAAREPGRFTAVGPDEGAVRLILDAAAMESLASLERIQLDATPPGVLRAPVRRGEETLAVLEWDGVSRSDYEREFEYIEGLCDSLGLVLENIRRARREALAAVGQAASEIVHDINHHCLVILRYADALQHDHSRAAPSGASTDAVVGIQRETERLHNMALDILDFARERIIIQRKSESLRDIAAQLREDLETILADTTVALRVAAEDDGEAELDLPRFRRAAMNLARNAAAAMPGGGEFSLRIESQNDQIYFVFEDNGPGLPPEIGDRIFEPFEQGDSGRGFGLGLAVVRRIVQAHGGSIHLHSQPGQGSRFTIALPGSAQPAD